MGGVLCLEHRSYISGDIPFNRYVADYMMVNKDLISGIREGMKARREGRIRDWKDIKRELNID